MTSSNDTLLLIMLPAIFVFSFLMLFALKTIINMLKELKSEVRENREEIRKLSTKE